MHVINFKTEKEPKMKFFDFWEFKERQKLSHDKIIFHMLFGAFHNTSHISNGPYDGDSDVDDIVINHLSCHDRTSILVLAAGIYIF